MSRRELLLRWVLGTLGLAGWVALCFALGDAGGPLLAMPPLLAIGATVIAGAAGVLGTVVVAGLTVGNLIAIGSTVYGVYSAKKAQRQAARDAVNAYNKGLQDRMTTLMDAEAPWQSIYGEPWVAPVMIAAMLTSGDRDQFKHVVYVWATHECEGIGEVTLRGVPIGALDASGWVVGGAFMTGERITNEVVVTLDANARGVLTPEASAWQGLVGLGPGPGEAQVLAPLAGNLATLAGGAVQVQAPHVAAWAGRTVRVTGYRDTGTPRLRVRHFLGSPDQVADPVLMAECPGEWTAADRGRGICYSVVTYDLNLQEFQNGPLEIKARIKGKRLLDHRTGATAWSACNALVASDYLRSEQGKAAALEHLELPTFNAGANDCDQVVPYVLQYPNGSLENRNAPRYTFHGAIRSDADPDQVLDLIAQSMGGTLTRTAGLWSLQAGVYTEPVMTLGPEDRMGPLEAVEGEEGRAVFNALRGKFYDPARFGERTDFPPYRNTAFAAEDGGVIWDDIDLPYTDEIWRCWYLCRLHVESNRGENLVYPAKRRARKLKPGNRVRINEPAWNIENVIYRVVKREWRLGGPVMLYLQQDAPEVWDQTDAQHSLPPSAGVQPNPWAVLPVDGLDLVSGNSTLVLHQDGSVSARLKVTWNPPDDVYVTKGGELQIQTREVGASTWLPASPGSPGAGVAYVDNLPEGKVYEVRVRFVNSLLAESPWRSRLVLHAGKFASPTAPVWVSLTVSEGALRGSIQRNPDLDRALPEFLYGATLATAQPIPAVTDETGFLWASPPLGLVTVWAVNRDRSGGRSAGVSQTVTVTAAALGLGSAGEAMNANPACDQVSAWEFLAGGALSSPTTASGAVGTSFIRFVPGAVDQMAFSAETIPLNPAETYRLSASLLAMTGNARDMYLGVRMFRANGTELTGADTGWGGAFAGYVFGGVPVSDGTWRRVGNDFGAGTARPIPADVAYCRLLVWGQYTGAAAQFTQGAQDVRLVNVTAARAAAAAAATAQNAANAAQNSASIALSQLQTIRSNGYLDASEKPAIVKEWLAIAGERTGIVNQANTFGIVAERDSYTYTFDLLNGYLSSLSPPYNDTTSDTPITPAVDQAKWADFYSARQALLNKIADEAGKRSQWGGVAGRPKSFVVRSYGFDAAPGRPGSTAPAGWWGGVRDAETGTEVGGGYLGYAVTEIDRAGNRVGVTQGFFPLTNAALASDMAARLNAIPNGNFVVISTTDEPQGNRMAGGLPAAMYRCGASQVRFGSPQFAYRGAYILVGVAGCNEGNGVEILTPGGPGAWAELGFQVQNGVLTVSGANGGPRTLFDLGPVQTENLGPGAATGVHAVRVAGSTAITAVAFSPPSYGAFTRAAYVTLVPSPADTGLVVVLVTVSFNWEFTANNAPLGLDLCSALLGDAAVFDGFATQDVTGQVPAGASRVGSFVTTKRFAVPANASVTFGVYGQTFSGSSCVWKDIELRAEVIKR